MGEGVILIRMSMLVPFFLAMPSHFLSLVMTVSFLFLLLRVVHMSRFLVCSLSDTRALVQNVLDLSRLS